MPVKESVAVIGLGRFGLSVAQTLAENGHEVLGIDTDMRQVERAADFITQAVQADGTDESALLELGVREFDIGVVAIGSDIRYSIMAVLLLKKLRLPRVIAKAQEELHGEILSKVGADHVVYPSREMGVRVGHSITTSHLVDYMEVTRGYGISKLTVAKGLVGKQLADLQLKEKYGLTPLVLSRVQDTSVITNPSKYETLSEGDQLLLAGKDVDLDAWTSA
ncbi:MAG: potassium channel family protein [Chloroflexota bacterium]